MDHKYAIERQESINLSKKKLQEELRVIRDVANQTAKHYRGKSAKNNQM